MLCLLSYVNNMKTKNVFTRNRLLYILIVEIQAIFSLSVNFIYFLTPENRADLITRGLSFEQFKQTLEFWNLDPIWINED